MSDSSMREIPIVEDDQGEGFKEVINPFENYADAMQRRENELLEKLSKQAEFDMLRINHERQRPL